MGVERNGAASCDDIDFSCLLLWIPCTSLWLKPAIQLFVVEAHHADGQPYPTGFSLKHVCVAQRHALILYRHTLIFYCSASYINNWFINHETHAHSSSTPHLPATYSSITLVQHCSSTSDNVNCVLMQWLQLRAFSSKAVSGTKVAVQSVCAKVKASSCLL